MSLVTEKSWKYECQHVSMLFIFFKLKRLNVHSNPKTKVLELAYIPSNSNELFRVVLHIILIINNAIRH